MLIKLLVRDEGKGNEVMNRKRFEEEFTGGELALPKKNRRPEDYETLFSGNTDDTFRLGLTLSKKCVKVRLLKHFTAITLKLTKAYYRQSFLTCV